MTTIAKRSFSGGEVAPALYARVDQNKYQTGLKTERNCYTMKHGGAENRSGTEYVAEVADSSKSTRLLEFIFNDTQTYAIEVGEDYMRFYKNGARLEEAAVSATAITQANPAVVTVTGHPLTNGQSIRMGQSSMIELDERDFVVANVTANTFELVGEDSTGHAAFIGTASVYEIYELVTPYQEDQLFDLSFVQSADTVTIVHPSHPPAELTRTGDLAWSHDEISFNPLVTRPSALSATGGGAGTAYDHNYRITGIDPDTGEESLAGTNTVTSTITGITKTDPATITIGAGHAFADNDKIYINGVGGMNELNGREFTVTNVSGNDFDLESIDSTAYTTFTSAGSVNLITFKHQTAAVLSNANVVTVTWTRPTGIQEFNIYKQSGGIFGLLAIVEGETYDDIGVSVDTTDTIPKFKEPFFGANNYPSTVTYVQQRLALGNTNTKPETIWLSKTGNFHNFTTSKPIQADDSISFNMASREVNEIRNMVDLRGLVILTSGGEWNAGGDSSGTITPTAINTKQYGYSGSSGLKPITTGASALFVQSRGSVIRDLGYNFEADGYSGNDLTIFSSHLFEGKSIVDWGLQQIPHSLVWVVRDDGVLLSLTYIKEQKMLAWAQHDTDGFFESVTIIPEGNEDVPYFIVKRTINGVTKRYVEKFNSRYISDITDLKLMDCNKTWTSPTTAINMTISGGTLWTAYETLTLTAASAYFTALSVGLDLHFTEANGDKFIFTVGTYSSTTVVTGTVSRTVPAAFQSVATMLWQEARKTFTGLLHLEGKAVSVFGDGMVVASPNNASYDTVTVAGGAITLDQSFVKAHIGLPVTADIETLDIDSVNTVLLDESAIVNSLTLFVEESRGIFAGPKPPTNDSVDPLEGLTEFKIREITEYEENIELKTGTIDVNIKGIWSEGGRVFIRQVDPLPMTILAISPSGKFLTGA